MEGFYMFGRARNNNEGCKGTVVMKSGSTIGGADMKSGGWRLLISAKNPEMKAGNLI